MQAGTMLASKHNDSDDLWDRDVARIQAQGVKPAVMRWYVIRAEQYVRAVAQQRLADHTPQDVIHYLEKLGRMGRIPDWQYRQTVEAIQHLLLLAEVAWAQQFDWAYWQVSARTLSVNHPTIAREGAAMPRPGNGEALLMDAGHLVAARNTPAPWRQALIAEIRRRGYSIRTEQAYESWVERFLAFCDHADPGDIGSREVLAFL